jgi:ribosomal protein L37AE/L43A
MSRGQYYRWNKKETVEDYRQLCIRGLQRFKAIEIGAGFHNRTLAWTNRNTGEKTSSIGYESDVNWDGEGYFRVHYTRTNSGKSYDYKIRISATKPHYGGLRLWFHCPKCDKRVEKLYSFGIYACRKCCNLTYSSQQQSMAFRYLEQANKIIHKLCKDEDLLWTVMDGCPPKPKGMHWRTYHRLEEKFEYYDRMSLAKML